MHRIINLTGSLPDCMFDTFCVAHHRKEPVVSKLLSNISFLINILNLHSAKTYHEKENGVLSETRGDRSLMCLLFLGIPKKHKKVSSEEVCWGREHKYANCWQI